MKRNILFFFTKGNERSVNVKKNIVLMILIKGCSILLSLLLVPLTLDYVDNECYGVWLALSSMVVWISFFDIGINNGLRNKLTAALAHNDYNLGRKYVSTTYAILFLIFMPLMCLLLLAAPFVDWYSLLNINQSNVEGLLIAICIIITYFCAVSSAEAQNLREKHWNRRCVPARRAGKGICGCAKRLQNARAERAFC